MFRYQQQVIALSNSGNTPEVVQLLPHLRRRKVEVLGMVGVPLTDLPPASVLSQSADLVLRVGFGGVPLQTFLWTRSLCHPCLAHASCPAQTMHVPTGNELLGVIPTRSIVAQVWLHALAAAAMWRHVAAP